MSNNVRLTSEDLTAIKAALVGADEETSGTILSTIAIGHVALLLIEVLPADARPSFLANLAQNYPEDWNRAAEILIAQEQATIPVHYDNGTTEPPPAPLPAPGGNEVHRG